VYKQSTIFTNLRLQLSFLPRDVKRGIAAVSCPSVRL